MSFVTLTLVRSGQRYTDDGELIDSREPVQVNPAHVRSFNARRYGEAGTRLTFADGHGFAVAEDLATVSAALGAPAIAAPALPAPSEAAEAAAE